MLPSMAGYVIVDRDIHRANAVSMPLGGGYLSTSIEKAKELEQLKGLAPILLLENGIVDRARIRELASYFGNGCTIFSYKPETTPDEIAEEVTDIINHQEETGETSSISKPSSIDVHCIHGKEPSFSD